jgi:hypothetical protein
MLKHVATVKANDRPDRAAVRHLGPPALEEAVSLACGTKLYVMDDEGSLAAENDALRADAERYRTARKMRPVQWAAAWELNIRTGKPFDQIIDQLRPFTQAPGGKP